MSPLWWPNLDWQVAKARGLLQRVFTWDTLGLILFTLGETKSWEKAVGIGIEPTTKMVLTMIESLSCFLAD